MKMNRRIQTHSRWEPFIDDWLIAETKGASLKLHPTEKKEIVLVMDRPWEGAMSTYFSIVQDKEKIRLYYRGYCPASDISEEQVTCYAESQDGIHFDRPELDLFEFEGSKRNNIVLRGMLAHNFAPFLDGSISAPPQERYKAVAGTGVTEQQILGNTGALYGLYSEDGIRWSMLQEAPIMTDGAFDSHNIVFWDSQSEVYRCYNRYMNGSIRAVQSTVSSDFKNWQPQEHNRYQENVPYEHFYTNATIPYPGAEHLYLSIPMRFVPERTKFTEHTHTGIRMPS